MIYFDTDTDSLLTYANGKWQSDRGEYTVVAASNSTQAEKDSADYVADGNGGGAGDGDQVQINSAISAVSAAGGGTVFLLEGTYTIDAVINLSSNIKLVGSGYATVITIPNSLNATIDFFSAVSDTYSSISSLQIDGNRSNQSSGTQTAVYVDPTASHITVDDVTIENMRSFGAYFDGDNSVLSNSTVTNSDVGVYVSAYGSLIEANDIQTSLTYGIQTATTSADATITGNYFYNNGTSGSSQGAIDMGASGSIAGNVFDADRNGIYASADELTITGNRIRNIDNNAVTLTNIDEVASGNVIENAGGVGILVTANATNLINNDINGSASHGIQVQSDLNNITGNTLGYNDGANIMLDSSANRNLINSNVIEGAGTHGITLTGNSDDNTISDNYIYTSGQVTASSDGININATGGASDNNRVIGNRITDTAGSGVAINIAATVTGTYLADNTYSGTGAASITNSGTGTVFANQLDNSGNLELQAGASGNIELLSNITSTGTLTFSGVGTDITTGTNETLTIAPNGTGDVSISIDNDTNFQLTGTITDDGAAQVIGVTLGDDGNNDAVAGLQINATSANTANSDSLFGLYVADLSASDGAVWENGIIVGGGWDNNLFFDDISAIVGINDGFLQFQNTSTTELVTIYNSGGIRLNINGDLQTGATTRLDSAGALSNITGYNQSSGLFDITSAVIQGTNALVFEGSSADANETTFAITNPTADRTVTFADASGTVALNTSGSATAGVSAFVQGGNTWAGTATLGTNDANSLVLETNNQAALTIASGGAVTLQNASNSANAFRIQDSNGVNALRVGTSQISVLPNLVTNGSVEINTTGWSARAGTTMTRVSTQANKGDYSLEAQTNASGEGVNYSISLTSATQYTMSFMARVSAGSGNILTYGYAEDGSTETDCKTSQSVPNTTGWRLHNCTFTTGTVSGSPYFYIKVSNATARNLYIDSFQIVINDNVGSYGEGTIDLDGIIRSPVSIRTVEDSSSALSVQSSNGRGVFSVDTNTLRVGIGLDKPTAQLTIGNVIPGDDSLTINQGSTGEGITVNLSSTSGTNSNGLAINRSGAGGTTTNGISINQSAGTLTNGLYFSGTIGTDITTASGRDLTVVAGGSGSVLLNDSVVLGASSSDLLTVNGVLQGTNALVFEGSGADANETTFAITNPTTDQTITFPDASGTVALITSGSSVTGISAFIQGGNTWAGTATLGTNDANSLIVETNNTTALTITSAQAATFAGDLNINGNTTLGDATSDTVTFTGRVNSDILPSTNDTYNLGSDANRWANLFLGGETIHLGTSTSDEAAISYVTATDSLTIKNATDSTTALQVQRNTGSTPVLTVDTTNSKTILRGINSDATQGSELITSNAFNNGTYWTVGTGWSGGASSVTGTSATGTVVATSSNVTISSGVTYQVQFTISGYTSGNVTVSFGGAGAAGISGNGTNITVNGTTSSTAALTFTGGSFSGVISAVSIKVITKNNSTIELQDEAGVKSSEIRTGNAGMNSLYFGLFAGDIADASSYNNLGIGNGTLQFNSSGADNVGLGQNALNRNTSGSENTAVGSSALAGNVTGIDNVAIGFGALSGLTVGNSNISLGASSGAALTSGSNNILIGYAADTAAGDTSNFLNIGGSLYGDLSNDRIAIGTTTTSAARLTVTNSASSDSIFVAQDNTTAVFSIVNGGGVTFANETNSATAFRIQNATAADTLLTADTAARSGSGGNLIKIGDSTGTDTNTTILQLDGATAVPTTNLSALNGGLFYNTTTNKVSIIENGTVKVLCNQTDASCGGNSTTLQQSYDADADGSDATIALTSTDGSIVISNPSSGGSTSAYVLNVNQQATGAVGGLDVQSSGTGNLLRVRDSTATAADVLTIADGGATTFRTQTDSVSSFQIQNSAGSNLMTVDSVYGSINYTAYSDFESGLSTPWGGFGKIGNLLYDSEDFSAGAWTATNVTVTADTTADPYGGGSVSADSLVSSGAGTHTVVQTASVSGITAGPATYSVWIKTASGTQPFDLRIDSVAGTPTTGTARSFTATTTWKRYHVTQNFTGAITDYKPTIVITNHSATIIAWGAQLMTGSTPAAYSYTSNDASYFAGNKSGLSVLGDINLAGGGCLWFGQGDANQTSEICNNGFDSVNGITLNSRSNNLILTATSTNSVEFNGLNTDITTTGNEALTITAAGSGDIVFDTDTNTNLQLTPSAASTVDLFAISATAGSGISTDNVDGIYLNIEGANGTSTDVSALHLDFDPITGSSDDTFSAILIDAITATAANEYGINIGAGWDANMFFNDTTTQIQIADGGTFTFEDSAGNDLLTVADAGTTGTVTVTGTLAANGDTITSDSNLTISATGYTKIGDSGSPTSSTADDDLYVQGELEVDSVLQADSSIYMDGAISGNAAITVQPTVTSTSNSSQYGIQNQVGFSVGSASGGTLTNLYGMINLPSITGNSTAISNVYGLYSRVDRSGTNTITNLFGSYYANGATTGVTNKYGLYVSNQSGGSSINYNLFIDSDTTDGGSEVFSINSAGLLVSRSTGNSSTQLEVYDGSSTTVTLLVADSTNDRLYVGDTTADSTGTVLVLDDKNTSGDPTGVNGAMYYNSNMGKFRCYENGIWTNCSDPSSISGAITLHEDFFSTNVGNANTIGTHGWTNDNTVCTFSNLTYANSDTPDRPGVMDFSTGTTTTGCTLIRMGQLNAWQVGGNTTIETAVRVPTLSDGTNEYDFRAGLSDGMAGQGTDGVYFEYDRNTSTNWTLVTAAGGTRTKVTNTASNCSAGGSATAVAAATWYRLKAVINSAGSQVDFYINDAFVGCSTTNIPSGTQATQPNIHIEKSAGTTSRSVEVDYYSFVRPLTTKR
jgi:hypothetical protein